jgi:HEPN domain-containing protein
MNGVTSLLEYRKGRSPEREAHLRRLALQLVVQLPEDIQEAVDCLELAKVAVRTFLGDPKPV